MGILAFKSEWTCGTIFAARLTLALSRDMAAAVCICVQILAVIRKIHVLIRGPSVVLWLMRIHALRPVVLQVLLRAVCCFEAKHVKRVLIHGLLQLL